LSENILQQVHKHTIKLLNLQKLAITGIVRIITHY